MMKKVHVVLHSHWDREWYFTTSDSLVLLDQVLTDVIKTLEKNKSLSFCLDGQVSIIDDYLSVRPDNLSRMVTLVNHNQLEVGPWYTQTDTFYVSGESIVNNLYYGIHRCQQLFGTYMKVAYLPDTFGFSHDLPMIVSGFGIHHAIIWRGVDFQKNRIEPNFVWSHLSGDKVKTTVLHGGYGAFKKANSSPVFMKKQLKPLLSNIAEMTAQDHILMPVGNDQLNINHLIQTHLSNYGDHFVLSRYQDFFDCFEATKAPEFSGEFREPRYARVHRTSGGVRVDIKNSNYKAEQQLIRITQPLSVLAQDLGIDVGVGIIERSWKKLFEGQAHDGIVGCVSDDTALDILNRNKQAYELAKSQENLIKKQLGHHIVLCEEEVLLFNLTLKKATQAQLIEVFSYDEHIVFENVIFSEIIASTLIKGHENALIERPEGNEYQKERDYYRHLMLVKVELDPMSYATIKYKAVHEDKKQSLTVNDQTINNESYCFKIVNNKLQLITKNNVYTDFIRVVDQGNAGDTYDFSPLPEESQVIYFDISSVQTTKKQFSQLMNIEFVARLPLNIQDRIEQRFNARATMKLSILLIEGEAPQFDFYFNNQVDNHRLRIGFQLGNVATQSLASSPFGWIERDIVNESALFGWQDVSLECPIDVHPNSGIVGTVGSGIRPWILNKGIKEYQIKGEHAYFTCFSSTDELGKADLLYRPGRASGDVTKKGHVRILTPMAQVHGLHHYQFKVLESADKNEVRAEFERFETLPCFYQSQQFNLFYERIDNKIDLIDEVRALPRMMKNEVHFIENCISTLYLSVYDKSPVIRFYPLVDMPIDAHLKQHYVFCDLLEVPIADITKLQSNKLYTAKRLK